MVVTAFFYAATAKIDQVETALRKRYAEMLTDVLAENRKRTEKSALEQIYKNADGALVVLWQDGPYTCWAESELLLADDDQLVALSAELGTVLFAMIGDHGGSYAFGMFRDGESLRWIQNDWELSGAPIPEEDGIDPATLDGDNVEAIWQRFGLRPLFEGIAPFRVLIAPRLTEPTASAPPESTLAEPPRRKPWWKFW
jgi:hypothetical protein